MESEKFAPSARVNPISVLEWPMYDKSARGHSSLQYHWHLLATTIVCGAVPAAANAGAVVMAERAEAEPDASAPAQPQSAVAVDTITTGVAKGRDRLDSATSTSVLRADQIRDLGARSLGDVLRALPGLRVEPFSGDSNASLTIRGLPLASSGSKFLQIQEDGLPGLEFGDISALSADAPLRVDYNLAQIEVIRGGSASTFASNSPGGIINLQSKTGEVEAGAVALTTGLDFGQYRLDADYGGRLSDHVRFHVGGFYRQGEGPRRTGYDSQRGGQIKANITKEFSTGYIRLYGKYLNDRGPFYDAVPMRVTGTGADPKLTPIARFDPRRDTMMSRYNQSLLLLNGDNAIALEDGTRGQQARQAAVGLEARFDIAGWTVTERFRYASLSGGFTTPFAIRYLPARTAMAALGGATRLLYANGPAAGQTIADPSALNDNGLVALLNMIDLPVRDYGNVTNDVRASRVWSLGESELTATGGIYTARQTIDRDVLWVTKLSEVRGGGNAALLDMIDAQGRPITQNGVFSYALAGTDGRRSRLDTRYAILAPFGALNYHVGRMSIGGSLRYDRGTVRGETFAASLGGGRIGTTTRDMNGDGVITAPETRVGITPLANPAPVDYGYGYWSYSTGVNFRISDPLAIFARYSRGARANADRILSRAFLNVSSGTLRDPDTAYDPVRQAEAGVKYRTSTLTLNLTGFWARAQDSNQDSVSGQGISRQYKAMGLEFEGGYRTGPFSVTAGGTYTHAEIVADRVNPALVGNTPRNQPSFLFQVTPQYEAGRLSVGAAVMGQTRAWSQDVNLLRLPGFTTVNAFAGYNVTERFNLMVNANNLFNTLAVGAIDDPSIPAAGIVRARIFNGRTVSATARLSI